MRKLILVVLASIAVLVSVGCKAKEGAKCKLNSDCADGKYCTTPEDGVVESTCMTEKNAIAACATGPTCTKWHKCNFDHSTGVCKP